jgi:predicted nuclease with TOPRIM domain
LKTQLVETQLEKERLASTAKQLVANLQDLQSDLQTTENAKQELLHNMSRHHKDDVNKLKVTNVLR